MSQGFASGLAFGEGGHISSIVVGWLEPPDNL